MDPSERDRGRRQVGGTDRSRGCASKADVAADRNRHQGNLEISAAPRDCSIVLVVGEVACSRSNDWGCGPMSLMVTGGSYAVGDVDDPHLQEWVHSSSTQAMSAVCLEFAR